MKDHEREDFLVGCGVICLIGSVFLLIAGSILAILSPFIAFSVWLLK